MKKFLPLLLALLLCFPLAGCGNKNTEPAPVPDYPVEVNGTKILEKPTAVASLSPSLTLTLEGLGLAGRLTGISEYCNPPQDEWDYRYNRCGTAYSLSLSGLRRAAPQVLFSPTPLTDSQMTQLQQMGIDLVVIPPATDLASLRQNYTDLFRTLYGETEGRRRAEEYLSWFDGRLREIGDRAGREESAGQGVYLTAGLLTMATGDTLEGALLELLGLENAGAPYTDYIYPAEREVELDPDVVFTNGLLSREEVAASSCYKTTKAGKAGRIYQLTPLPLESQAPQLILNTLWKMGDLLYPQAFVRTPLPSYDQGPAEGQTAPPEGEEPAPQGDTAA